MVTDLTIYDQDKTALEPVVFVADVINQTKVRNIDSYEFTKQFGMLVIRILVAQGIKGEISDFHKADIKQLILSRFKNLSLNEIEYAFKMERYGSLGEKTEHYQLFDANYVSTVLGKYVDWKADLRKAHNMEIAKPRAATELKEEDQKYLIYKGVLEAFDCAVNHGDIPDGKTYVYDVLYDLGVLPTDPESKWKMYEAAKEAVRINEVLREGKTRKEKDHIWFLIAELEKKTSDYVVVTAKRMTVCAYFRKTTREELDALLINKL